MLEKKETQESTSIDQATSDATYTGVTLYVRDSGLNMSDFLNESLGTLFVSESDIYVRNVFDGLRKGIRLYFFSNHVNPASSKEHLEHKNVFEIKKGDHFKLIARTTYHEKGALIFLHLPKEGWEEFSKDTSLIDGLLINYAIREFEVQCDSKEDHKTRDWLYVEKDTVILKPAQGEKDSSDMDSLNSQTDSIIAEEQTK